MVRWAWWDWGLSRWLTSLLQCFDTLGWVITHQTCKNIVSEITSRVHGMMGRYSSQLISVCFCLLLRLCVCMCACTCWLMDNVPEHHPSSAGMFSIIFWPEPVIFREEFQKISVACAAWQSVSGTLSLSLSLSAWVVMSVRWNIDQSAMDVTCSEVHKGMSNSYLVHLHEVSQISWIFLPVYFLKIMVWKLRDYLRSAVAYIHTVCHGRWSCSHGAWGDAEMRSSEIFEGHEGDAFSILLIVTPKFMLWASDVLPLTMSAVCPWTQLHGDYAPDSVYRLASVTHRIILPTVSRHPAITGVYDVSFS